MSRMETAVIFILMSLLYLNDLMLGLISLSAAKAPSDAYSTLLPLGIISMLIASYGVFIVNTEIIKGYKARKNKVQPAQ